MSRKPRARRTTEPPTTILTLAARGVDYTGADLAAVAVELGITGRLIPHVTVDTATHTLYREWFTDFAAAEAAPWFESTARDLGDPLPGRSGAGDVVEGVVVESRTAVPA